MISDDRYLYKVTDSLVTAPLLKCGEITTASKQQVKLRKKYV